MAETSPVEFCRSRQPLKRQYTLPKCENQIFARASVIKRGRLAIGIVLFVRGNKIHYYSPAHQKKISVFSDWLFSMPVSLGDKQIKDFDQFKTELTVSREIISFEKQRHRNIKDIRNVFSNIETQVISNSVATLTNQITKQNESLQRQLTSIQETLKKQDQPTRFIDNNINTNIAHIEKELQKLREVIKQIDISQETHVTNELKFENCHFATNEQSRGDQFNDQSQENSDDDTIPDASQDGWQQSSEDSDEDIASDAASAHEDTHRLYQTDKGTAFHLFCWKKSLSAYKRRAFINYYKQFPIVDVVHGELQWLKEHNHLDAFTCVAALFDRGKPYQFEPRYQFLSSLFDILKFSRLNRENA